MDQRYGAWAQLLALFRMVHDGAHAAGDCSCRPPRRSVRPRPLPVPGGPRRLQADGRSTSASSRRSCPTASIFRVLQNLLMLDGERLSYRTLDVEQIGSVYETMMGFRLEWRRDARSRSSRTKPHGAPTTINLEELLAVKPAERASGSRTTPTKLTGQAAAAVKDGATLDDLHVALWRR